MSEIIEAFTEMVKVIADNPASILIVLGFFSILIAVFIPLPKVQLIFGAMGVLMMLVGIVLHVMWLQR
jgi:threonine/homoserine/homoserine lactone efflux protein